MIWYFYYRRTTNKSEKNNTLWSKIKWRNVLISCNTVKIINKENSCWSSVGMTGNNILRLISFFSLNWNRTNWKRTKPSQTKQNWSAWEWLEKKIRSEKYRNILKVSRRILFLATIHAKPLRAITNLWNHISITHLKTCCSITNAIEREKTFITHLHAQRPTKSYENKWTQWWQSASLEIYVTRNFPTLRFIFAFWQSVFLFRTCKFYFTFHERMKCSSVGHLNGCTLFGSPHTYAHTVQLILHSLISTMTIELPYRKDLDLTLAVAESFFFISLIPGIILSILLLSAFRPHFEPFYS